MGTLLQFLPYILQIFQMAPAIKTAWDSSTTGTMGAIQAVIQNSPAIPTLEAMGAQLFPKLAPTIHAAAAAIVTVHPDATSWLQSALNVIDNAGLKVDGHYGPLTRAAVEAFQAKKGLAVTGFAADAENAALMAAMAALGG